MKKNIIVLAILICLSLNKCMQEEYSLLPVTDINSHGEVITPTDVYYLALEIDNSLVALHNLYTIQKKEPVILRTTLANNYRRAVALLEEYNAVHRNALNIEPIHNEVITTLRKRAQRGKKQPHDVFNVLEYIKRDIEQKGAYIPYTEDRITKTPNDVYEILHVISGHHLEILYRELSIPWNKPEQVFEINLFGVRTVLEKLLENSDIEVATFQFKSETDTSIKPKDVYALQIQLHELIASLNNEKDELHKNAILINENLPDSISPMDVYNITNVILSELETLYDQEYKPDMKTLNDYEQWKFEHGAILPGDVYQLVKENIILANQLILSKQ